MYQILSLAIVLVVPATGCPIEERHIEERQNNGCPQYNFLQQGRDWGNLCPAYRVCSTGTQQSPINLPFRQYANTHRPTFGFPGGSSPSGYFYNTGFQPQWMPNPGQTTPTLSFDGQTFSLLQWHTHTPTSEHAIGGAFTASEIHLVFGTGTTARAVVGVFLNAGVLPSAFYKDIYQQLDSSGERLPPPGSTRNATDIKPDFKLLFNQDFFTDYWTYQGSLTFPGCTEGFRWFVSGKVENLDAVQLLRLNTASVFSVRALQRIQNQQVNV